MSVPSGPETKTEPGAVRRIPPVEARALVTSGSAVLVDTRDRRLYDNLHPVGALSLPLAEIEATGGRPPRGSLPSDGLLILYCA